MRLRVKPGSLKGYRVYGRMVEPGKLLPGDYATIPDGMSDRLEAADELEEMTRDQLYDYGQRRGVALRTNLRKEQLVEAIRGHDGQ